MTKNFNIRILIRKYRAKILIGLLSFFLVNWLINLFNPLFTRFNEYLIYKSVPLISASIAYTQSILSIKVPVYSLLFFLLLVFTIYKAYRRIALNYGEFKIVKADYGSGSTFIDITNRLNDLIVDNKLNITLSNGIPGIDPTPGVVKVGNIRYKSNNKTFDKHYKENDLIDLP